MGRFNDHNSSNGNGPNDEPFNPDDEEAKRSSD